MSAAWTRTDRRLALRHSDVAGDRGSCHRGAGGVPFVASAPAWHGPRGAAQPVERVPGVLSVTHPGLTQDGRVEEREGAIAMPAHRVELHEVDGTAASLLEVLGRQPSRRLPSPRRPSRRCRPRGRACACASEARSYGSAMTSPSRGIRTWRPWRWCGRSSRQEARSRRAAARSYGREPATGAGAAGASRRRARDSPGRRRSRPE